MMTVGELIERLQDFDPQARVHLMMQPSWPFEYSIAGVTARDEFTESAWDEDGNDTAIDTDGGEHADDVFLCEGQQLRYGNRKAWDTAW